MRKENDRVPPPWGDDMEKALMIRTPSSLDLLG
jgi:hypothetical protein